MNLFQWIGIKAETMIKDRKTKDSNRLNPLLTTHFANVAKVQRQIKNDGDIIQMTKQAQSIKDADDPDLKRYQSVLYHGLTRAAEKKTFIETLPDGTLKTWTELVG